MATWVALSREVHRNSGWEKFNNYAFAQKDAVASLLMAELPHALPYYPIGFVQGVNNSYQLVVIQSLQAGVNLYVDQKGQWLAPYVPSVYRGYPFRLIQQEDQLVLCVDQDSECFHKTIQSGDTPIVNNETGELSEDLNAIMNFHKTRYQNELVTQELVNQLLAADLLVPWPIELKATDDSEASAVKGVFKVDEMALKELSSDKLTELQASGALGLAYGQLFSQIRLKDFGQRYEYFNKIHQKPLEVDLDKLFGEDDDSLKF